MHQETKRELVGNLARLCRDVAYDAWQYAQETKRLEKKHEIDRNLAEAKQEAEGHDDAPTEPVASGGEPAPRREPASGGVGGPGIEQAVDELMVDDTCGVCRQMLQAIKHCDDQSRQARALAEYGRLKQGVEDDIPDAEWRGLLEDSAVLQELLEEHAEAR